MRSLVKKRKVEEMNLIPIMNLMMCLIPFLLLGAAFYHIGVIPTSLPTHTPSGSDEPDKPEVIVTLNMKIEPGAIKINGSATGLSDDDIEGIAAEFPRGPDGKFPLDRLQAKILSIKLAYPKSDTVIVLPDDSVPYQELVEILDVTRERIVPVEGKDPRREPLFPVTVFSRLITPDPDELDDEGAQGTSLPVPGPKKRGRKGRNR